MPFKRYNANWPDDYDDLAVEMACIQKGGNWKNKKGEDCGEGLIHHYEQMRRILWPEVDDHRWYKLCRDTVIENKFTVLTGCSSCVDGDTKILNPITGEEPTIRELCEKGIAPVVQTLYGPVQASVPFKKGTTDLYEVILENGVKFIATGQHRVLADSGFVRVDAASIGQFLYTYSPCLVPSSLGLDPSVREQGEYCSRKKAEDYQAGYPTLFRCGDEQLLSARDAYRSSSPSQGDAREYIQSSDSHPGVQEREQVRNQTYQQHDRLSNCNASHREPPSRIAEFPHGDEEILSRGTRSFQQRAQSHSASHHHHSFLEQDHDSWSTPKLLCDKRLVETSLQETGDQHEQSACESQIQGQRASDFCPLNTTQEGVDFEPEFSPFAGPSSFSLVKRGSTTLYTVARSEVVSIRWIKKDDYYDLCVPDVHHYFAEGAIHHNSGKTFTPSWVFLCEYICFPEETCVLITSTTIEGLRMRVWGEINRLWSSAVRRFGRDRIPGFLVDSRLLIATQDINEKTEDAVLSRDWRQGIKGIACIQGNRYTGGLDRWVGIKQKRLRVIADECQYLPANYLDAFVNLSSNTDFKAVILGNPKTKTDALGRAAEPKDGWENYLNPEKTIVWDTKMFDGKCVNLVGTDSPNFDFDQTKPPRYPYLMHAGKIKDILTTCAKDSETYLTFCVGTFKVSTLDRRVVTKEMCKKFKAQEDVTWDSMERTRVCALDAAYGGDRCIVGCADFARTRNDGMILSIVDYREIPVVARPDGMSAEDQISTFMLNYSHEFDIKPENFWHDATGRGSLGTSLARIWSALCNPLEFGGRPSKRPVTLDMMIDDPVDGMRRLKRCDEHYDRFVSELAFSVRYVIEGGQMRNLPTEIMDELVLRKWDLIRGDKISIEPKTGTPTKPGFKQLNGFSPDLADFLSIICEAARQRGFEIKKLGTATEEEAEIDFFADEAKRWSSAIKSNLLEHA